MPNKSILEKAYSAYLNLKDDEDKMDEIFNKCDREYDENEIEEILKTYSQTFTI